MDFPATHLLLRKWLKTELSLLTKMMKRSLRNENQRNLNKKVVQFPYSMDINKQVYSTGTFLYMLVEVILCTNNNKTCNMKDLLQTQTTIPEPSTSVILIYSLTFILITTSHQPRPHHHWIGSSSLSIITCLHHKISVHSWHLIHH